MLNFKRVSGDKSLVYKGFSVGAAGRSRTCDPQIRSRILIRKQIPNLSSYINNIRSVTFKHDLPEFTRICLWKNYEIGGKLGENPQDLFSPISKRDTKGSLKISQNLCGGVEGHATYVKGKELDPRGSAKRAEIISKPVLDCLSRNGIAGIKPGPHTFIRSYCNQSSEVNADLLQFTPNIAGGQDVCSNRNESL